MGWFRADDGPIVDGQQARYWSAGIHCNNRMGSEPDGLDWCVSVWLQCAITAPKHHAKNN